MKSLMIILLTVLTHAALGQSWVEDVYHNLTQSLGNTQREYPKLEIIDEKDAIARYSNRKNTIYLETEVITFVDKSFGARRSDAIAYILAHELGHFVYNHGWMRRAGERFASKETIRQLYKIDISREQYLADEATADTFAALYTVLSGYSSIDIADDLLTGLYAEYQIPEKVEGYLSLYERLELIKTTDEYVNQMLPIYWAGNYTLLVGNYDGAIDCYRYLLSRQLGNAEIYNNLGLSYLMKARRTVSLDNLHVYPLPLVESNADLSNGLLSFSEGNSEQLLNAASDAFERSINLNDNNYSAYQNNIVALHMLYQITGDEDYEEDANYWLRKAKRLPEENTGQLGFMTEGTGTGLTSAAPSKPPEKSAIDIYTDRNLKGVLDGQMKFQRKIDLGDHFLEVTAFPNSMYYRLRPQRIMTGQTSVMFEANNSYRQPSPEGILLNDDVKILVEKMGKPEEEITDGPNVFYGYESKNIIYRLRNGKVLGWVNYRNINAR